MEALSGSMRQRQQLAKDGDSLFGLERVLGFLWQNPLTCGACRLGMSTFDYVLDSALVRGTLEFIGTVACSFFIDYRVCYGAVNEMTEVLVPQMVDFVLTPAFSCARLMGFCSAPKWKTLDAQEYIDRILADKPEFLKDNDYVNQQYKKINEDPEKRKTVKLLHITDVHLDFAYKEGMNANCNEPLCCREINGLAPTPADAAGKYGSYN